MPDQLYDAIEATWPPASAFRSGPWMIREGQGGGKRVSAATMEDNVSVHDIPLATSAMRDLGQQELFMIRDREERLDRLLHESGFSIIDPVDIYTAPVESFTKEPLPPVSAFDLWPPMAIQRDIWVEGGIGSGRLAVMERVKGPKTAILARSDDQPAGSAFVAIHGPVAMIHAIEVPARLRRKGVGANIMRAAGHWAARNGADHLALLVTSANIAANGLYKSLGMKVVGHYHYRIK